MGFAIPLIAISVLAFLKIIVEQKYVDQTFKNEYVKPITLEEVTEHNLFCTITLPDDIPAQSPVYLTPAGQSYKLFKPAGKVTFLPKHSRLLLACTGKRINNVVRENVRNLELTCSEGKNFVTANNVRYTLKDLHCTDQSNSTLKTTSNECANGHGEIHEVGFEYNGNQFAPLFSICYNQSISRTVYTENTINGAAIQYDVKKRERPQFEADGMHYSTTVINNLYIKRRQSAQFEKLFGSATHYYNDKQLFLSRGHFTPDADMVFAYEKLATYYYANVAPQYQSINGGNWQTVEDKARALAIAAGGDLLTYNGPLEILKLPMPSDKTTEVEVSLDANIRIHAPKYYFKVLQMENDGIVFITSNNPYATAVDVFCKDACSLLGVDDPKFKNYELGYTFCCHLSEFKLYDYDLHN